MAHTPGPWSVAEHPEWPPSECRIITAAAFDEIAYLRGPLDWPEQAANARLIAAAPELLEACKALLKFIGIVTDSEADAGIRPTATWNAVLEAAVDAIARAEGRQSAPAGGAVNSPAPGPASSPGSAASP